MKSQVYRALLVTVLSAFVSVQAADSLSEFESNHPIDSAQRVDIANGSIAINAFLGPANGTSARDDLDFYTFYGQEGDVVTLDIDDGYGDPTGGSVDTYIAVFGTGPGFPLLRTNDDAPATDPGSYSRWDALIKDFRVPATGYYIVGVTNSGRSFMQPGGGGVYYPNTVQNGDYTLIISGVSSALLHINIDVKPGSDEVAPINLKSKGRIPVALLSSSEFDATKASSLTFGSTGDESSFSHCGEAQDVNGDSLLDLVCHFYNSATGFKRGDLEGIMRGISGDGRAFEGRGPLKVKPEKRKQ